MSDLIHMSANVEAAQILLAHTTVESTALYLGVDVDNALALAESTEP